MPHMTRRTYRSERRAEQSERTRQDILDAARRLFVERGYAGTSIAAIAEAADVAVPTVYASVGAKPELLLRLQELVDAAGNVPEIHQQIGRSDDPVEILGLAAQLRRRMMENAGDIIGVVAASAPGNAEMAAAYARGQQASRAGIGRICARLDQLGALRADLTPEKATDVAYAVLHHAIYDRLVHELGWSADEFEAWCGEALSRLLLDPSR